MGIKVAVISLGCSKNLVDTEIMLGLLSKAGFTITTNQAEAEVMLINTCGFITPAKEEAIKTILETAQLKGKGKLRTLLVAGCLVQRYRDELLRGIPEIDGVLAPGDIGRVVPVLENALTGNCRRFLEGPAFDYGVEIPRVLTTPFHWAYVKIAEGCSNCCSYCAIPGIRGKYSSRPMEVLEKEVASLLKKGVQEIILVAQDTTVYGKDIYSRPMLAELLKRLAAQGVPWIRVMYCYPSEFNKELMQVMAQENNICKYIDLPLQHINDSVLTAMNRRGTSEEIKRLIFKLRETIPGLTLRTTFMVGFPGEGQAEYEDLYNFIGEARFDRIGVFKYSPEEGTAAVNMPDIVSDTVKEQRYNELMSLQRKISYKKNRSKIGTCLKVLVDSKKNKRGNLYIGRTEGDAPEIDGNVLFSAQSKEVITGSFVVVRVTGAFDYGLRGVLVNESS
jgi:ribosomal protein S12 methylthiotransferase